MVENDFVTKIRKTVSKKKALEETSFWYKPKEKITGPD